jgi:hypothetical protein
VIPWAARCAGRPSPAPPASRACARRRDPRREASRRGPLAALSVPGWVGAAQPRAYRLRRPRTDSRWWWWWWWWWWIWRWQLASRAPAARGSAPAGSRGSLARCAARTHARTHTRIIMPSFPSHPPSPAARRWARLSRRTARFGLPQPLPVSAVPSSPPLLTYLFLHRLRAADETRARAAVAAVAVVLDSEDRATSCASLRMMPRVSGCEQHRRHATSALCPCPCPCP